jgi:multidrug resistance efflux pump
MSTEKKLAEAEAEKARLQAENDKLKAELEAAKVSVSDGGLCRLAANTVL